MGRLGFNFTGINKNKYNCECNSVLVEDGREESFLNESENPSQDESNKKMYSVCFISTLVIICFCIFIVIPQLINHYAEENEISTNSDQKQTAVELLAAEKNPRKQERLDIFEKLDILQKNYKILQAQYENAKEAYLAKLHGSYGA